MRHEVVGYVCAVIPRVCVCVSMIKHKVMIYLKIIRLFKIQEKKTLFKLRGKRSEKWVKEENNDSSGELRA